MRTIVEATESYESWLENQTDVSAKSLRKKHRKMAETPFAFLRATFFRWVEQWPWVCPNLANRTADVLLAVGDLHADNFGLWRDSRGRLVWGMNDFDEACELPFTSDLVRLATSIALAISERRHAISPRDAQGLLLEGYRACLATGGQPILLDGDGATPPIDFPRLTPESAQGFWGRHLDPHAAPVIESDDLPPTVLELFRSAFLPGTALEFRKQKKPGGLGSLGRRRYSAIHQADGVCRAREAKALVPSALYWLQDRPAMPNQAASLLQRAIRSPDPEIQVHDRWLLRSFGPDFVKIELARLPDSEQDRAEPAWLRAMGWEAANMHLGSRSPDWLANALDALQAEFGADWLGAAADAMVSVTRSDHADWATHWAQA